MQLRFIRQVSAWWRETCSTGQEAWVFSPCYHSQPVWSSALQSDSPGLIGLPIQFTQTMKLMLQALLYTGIQSGGGKVPPWQMLSALRPQFWVVVVSGKRRFGRRALQPAGAASIHWPKPGGEEVAVSFNCRIREEWRRWAWGVSRV